MSAQLLAGEPQSPASPPETGTSAARQVSRAKLAGACGLVSVVLFAAYIRLSWTAPVNSDGAANVLQAYDMLHGNVLLHGWWLSNVSFYSTELPQYVLLEALLGAVPAVIHVAAAMTHTIVTQIRHAHGMRKPQVASSNHGDAHGCGVCNHSCSSVSADRIRPLTYAQ